MSCDVPATGIKDFDSEMIDHGGTCSHKMSIGQVTIRTPIAMRPSPILALFFSFVPWALPLLLVTDIVLNWRASSFFGAALVVICTISSEVVFKPLVHQPRPEITACRNEDGTLTNGMPSGHVLNSNTFFTWFTLKVIFQGPLVLSVNTCVLLVVLSLITIAMVPWSRWYNGDHTAFQVLSTGVAATVMGFLAFAVSEYCLPKSYSSLAASPAVSFTSVLLQDVDAVRHAAPRSLMHRHQQPGAFFLGIGQS